MKQPRVADLGKSVVFGRGEMRLGDDTLLRFFGGRRLGDGTVVGFYKTGNGDGVEVVVKNGEELAVHHATENITLPAGDAFSTEASFLDAMGLAMGSIPFSTPVAFSEQGSLLENVGA